MGSNVERDFRRSERTTRVANVIVLVGMLASLVLAFPMMIGFNPAIRTGIPLFFFVPFVVAVVISSVIKWVRE